MTIEKIEPVGRQEHLFSIHLSDGTVLKTQDHVIADFGLYTGMELDEKTMEDLRAAIGKASAKVRAVRIISASAVSQEELRRRLVQKGETERNAEEAVRWLEELQLVDDRKTAEQIVQSAVRKGYGSARIRQILYEKRIPKELWEQALQQLPQMDDAIDRFLQQKLGGRQPSDKELKRTVDALLRRGHSWQDIRSGLRRYQVSDDLYQEEPYE